MECLLITGVETGVLRQEEGVDRWPGVDSLGETSCTTLLEGPGHRLQYGLSIYYVIYVPWSEEAEALRKEDWCSWTYGVCLVIIFVKLALNICTYIH